MNKIKFLSILFILFAFNSNAQILNTLYNSDTIIIKGLDTNLGQDDFIEEEIIRVDNFDNDGFWSKVGDFFVHYDKHLNILDSINTNLDYKIKYNNTLYGLTYYYHYDYYTKIRMADSVKFFSYNLTNKSTYSKLLDTTDIDYYYTFHFMPERNEFVVASISNHKPNTPANFDKFRISIIDTLGNIVDSNTVYRPICRLSVVQQGKNIMVGAEKFDQSTIMYYIDKVTLYIVDSMYLPYGFSCLKAINDSNIVGECKNYLYMYNTNTKIGDSLYFRIPNLPIGSPGINNLHTIVDFVIDCKTPDSIFFCYSIFDYNESASNHGFHVDNFNFNGTFNYRYSFRGFKPDYFKLTFGVTAIDNDRVIINSIHRDNYTPNIYDPMLLKFSSRGGLIGLPDIKKEEVSLTIFPNPTRDKINFISCERIKRIELFNILGQAIYSKVIDSKNASINVSNYRKGNYIAKIETEKGISTQKFVIE